MSSLRQARAWLFVRRRFQFVATVAMVAVLTGTCAALLMVPNSVLPKLRAAQPTSIGSLARAAAADDDPRLTAVRRSLEPFGQIVTERVPTGNSQESLVVGHPAQRAEIDTLAAELGAATTAVTGVWGPGWAQSAVVVVSSNPSEFAALVRAGATMPADVAAASVADPFVPGTQPTGQRVVFSSDAGRRLDADGLRTLLRHELTHVATRAQTVDGAPQWMVEGFAEFIAHRGQGHHFTDIAPTVATRVRAGDIPRDLPADAEFSGTAAVAAYEQAWSVCAFVADKFDEPRLVELYRRIAAGKQDLGSEDRIMREVLGTSRGDLVADWRGWLSARTA
ncbi:hypothetical protein OG874_03840 [Nocardia sp. NBC_00565]|uniref:hypothetical protein n=1 Tax=Nocardia sp. NBC_00565 TaxID=2975993 RepID=UPI002E815913|nr:hypothetical protein [Nocardia sp. NBC_00565]WUC04350.1 hypothetical protein OG874_03840 [Nocardia sp. NBC_00565]